MKIMVDIDLVCVDEVIIKDDEYEVRQNLP